MAEYTYPLGRPGSPAGALVLRPHPQLRTRWEAVFIRPRGEATILNHFTSAQVAADAIATFQTGSDLWDALGDLEFISAEVAQRLRDLGRWQRTA